ncbi:MAG: SMC-Scp complex subunit ScpB, partial [Candidatus Omnitrophica bacterium]|nr:SMC-Scp complex subunit ScpB [Candidatus Omnitrophota bacterium]
IERRFARVVGRKESPGRPFLYGTTTEFLRHFGLKSIEALPPMATTTVKEPHVASEPPVASPAH